MLFSLEYSIADKADIRKWYTYPEDSKRKKKKWRKNKFVDN